MKVLEKGRDQKGWSTEAKCTGAGNGNGGCGALLLVEEPDLYCTFNTIRGETDVFVTFRCVECDVETDIKNYPADKKRNLRLKQEKESELARSSQ